MISPFCGSTSVHFYSRVERANEKSTGSAYFFMQTVKMAVNAETDA